MLTGFNQQRIIGFGPLSGSHLKLIRVLNSADPITNHEYFYVVPQPGDSGEAGRQKTRLVMRALFNTPQSRGRLAAPAPGSVIRQMMENDKAIGIAIIENNGNMTARVMEHEHQFPEKLFMLNKKAILRQQQEARAYYDPSVLSAADCAALHEVKAEKREPGSIQNIYWKSYFTTTIGQITQHMMGPTATTTNVTRYLSDIKFPNLSDYAQNQKYCHYNNQGNLSFKPEGVKLLKQDFKLILAFAIKSSHQHGVGLDLVTPHAFFNQLSTAEQKIAKMIFIEACAEVAVELDLPDFSGLVLHHDEESEALTKLQTIFKNKAPKFPVLCGLGLNASAPQLAATRENLPLIFADSIQGEPIHSIGNAALSDSAHRAKDEKDCRESAGESVYVLGSQFNARLTKASSFTAITQLLPNPQSAPTTYLASGGPTKKRPVDTTSEQPYDRIKARKKDDDDDDQEIDANNNNNNNNSKDGCFVM